MVSGDSEAAGRETLELSPSPSKYWTASTRENGESCAIDVDDLREVALLSSNASGAQSSNQSLGLIE